MSVRAESGLRGWLHQQEIPYVTATRCVDEVAFGVHTTTQLDQLTARIPARAWRRVSCGDGADGPRTYDWARLPAGTPRRIQHAG
jgi:hypothetical protein